jgi:hypothetical protein
MGAGRICMDSQVKVSALELLAFSNTQKKKHNNKQNAKKAKGPSRRSMPKSQTKSLSSPPE